ncbi:MAG: permease prefix domain 1-containing protein [Vicinamibacterales bacterium]
MTHERFDPYLRRLQRELRKHGLVSARIVNEARDHLLDAIDDGVRRGLPIEAAEHEALSRFGPADTIGNEFGQVYRWSYVLWYLAKVAATVVMSVAAALAIEVVVNLRVELAAEALRLTPGFGRTAIMAVAVVLGLVTAWEIGRPPFQWRRAVIAVCAYAAVWLSATLLFAQGVEVFGSAAFVVFLGYACSRLERRPARLGGTFAMFVLSLVVVHRVAHVAMEPTRAAIAAAVLIAIWTSTITILSRGEQLFSRLFVPQE